MGHSHRACSVVHVHCVHCIIHMHVQWTYILHLRGCREPVKLALIVLPQQRKRKTKEDTSFSCGLPSHLPMGIVGLPFL